MRKWLFTGLLVLVPGVITVWVLNWIISTLDQTLYLLPQGLHPDHLLGFHIPGFGVLLTLLSLLVDRRSSPANFARPQAGGVGRWAGQPHPGGDARSIQRQAGVRHPVLGQR